MGITVLPNQGAEIGQSLAVLGDALAKILNPNAAMQRAVQNLIATDSSALPRMAAALRNVPLERLQKMAGRTTAALIAGQPRTVAEITEGATSSFLGTEEGQVALGEGIEERVRGRTSEEIATSGQAVERGRAELEFLRGQLESERDVSSLKSLISRNAAEYIRDYMPADERRRRSVLEAAPRFLSPETNEEEFQNQLKLIQARTSDDYTRYQEDALVRLANSWALKAGGEPASYRRLFGDPTAYARARELVANPSLATSEEDKKLLEAARNVKLNTSDQDVFSRTVTTLTAIRTLEGQFRSTLTQQGLKKEQRESILKEQAALINSNIQALRPTREAVGQPLPNIKAEAYLNPRGFFGAAAWELRYTDDAGNSYTSEEVGKILNSPTTSQPQGFDLNSVHPGALSPNAREAYRRIRAGQGTLQQLMEVAPDLANEIIG